MNMVDATNTNTEAPAISGDAIETSPGIDLTEIVQLEECGMRRANQLLEAGYVCVGLASRAWEEKRRSSPKNENAAETFIRRDFRYVIARMRGQAPFPEVPDRKAGSTVEGGAAT